MPQAPLSYPQDASIARLDDWDHDTQNKPITVAEYVRLMPIIDATQKQALSYGTTVPKTHLGNQSPKKRLFRQLMRHENSCGLRGESWSLRRPPRTSGSSTDGTKEGVSLAN